MISAFVALGSLLAALIVLPMVRFIAGPSIPDRMVALDVMNTLVVSALLSFGLGFETPIYTDVAIVYSMLAYVSMLYIAKYVEGSL